MSGIGTFTPAARAAVALRQAVADAGGLASLAQLTARYQLSSRSSMSAIARETGFPAPLWTDDDGYRRLYAVGEVDAYMVERDGRRRR